MMVDYAYSTVTGKIKQLLEKIRTVGIPPKVTASWLKTIGFTSSNDTTLIGVLKFIGFTDQSGVPSATWSAFRGAKHKAILGDAIRRGYAELYAVYPDAHLRSNTELSHVFSTSSSAGAQVVAKTVATYKVLVEEAEFSTSVAPTETTMQNGPLHAPPAGASPQMSQLPQMQEGPTVHIDIQIHISPDSTAQQIEKILRAWRSIYTGARMNDASPRHRCNG